MNGGKDTMTKTLAIPQGVLAKQNLETLIEEGMIITPELGATSIQPATMDLRLGDNAWRVPAAFLCDDIKAKLAEYESLGYPKLDLREKAFFERGKTYVIQLQESFALPKYIRGKANAKSTTGRDDIFARLVCDGNKEFDIIRPGYTGEMHLVMTSMSFDCELTRGISLNQLRLQIHNPTQLSTRELRETFGTFGLLFDKEGNPIKDGHRHIYDGGLHLSLDLSDEIVGYRSKRNAPPLDLSLIGGHKTADYWEAIPRPDKGVLTLDPEHFYILISKERIRIPKIFAAEVVDFHSGIGEFRSHYAGFADPGFGYGEKGELAGAAMVFEARVRDMPMEIRDGQTFCKMVFERMSETPKVSYGGGISSNYQGQTTARLSKHFG